MKSLRSLVLVWYWDQREYILWIMAVTFPKTSACISAAGGRRGETRGAECEKEKKWEVSHHYCSGHSVGLHTILQMTVTTQEAKCPAGDFVKTTGRVQKETGQNIAIAWKR